jgi:HTH-type transcriptional regulator, competence development regulator
MRFSERVRLLRTSKGLSQRALGQMIGVSFTYVSKIENEKIDFGDYPSEDLIRKIAQALDVDEDEMLLLAEKVPERIKRRVFERPEVFRALALCDDKMLDFVMSKLGLQTTRNKANKKALLKPKSKGL